MSSKTQRAKAQAIVSEESVQKSERTADKPVPVMTAREAAEKVMRERRALFAALADR